MNAFINFLSTFMNMIIVIAGAVVGFFMIVNFFYLLGHYNQIKSTMNWKKTKTVLNKITKEIEDKADSENVTPDTIREMQTAFNKTCSWHEALAQLIPLFPLFGILGTVAGLIMQLNAQDSLGITGALNLALGSTLNGLIFAILLKFFDAIAPSRIINETDIILEDYDKKLNNAIMLGNISE